MRAEKAISTHMDEHLMLKRSKRIYLESYKFFTLYAQNYTRKIKAVLVARLRRERRF